MLHTNNVFVYGTLKEGFYNNRVMERAGGTSLGKRETEPNYTMANLGSFPGVYEGGSTVVKGELYSVLDLGPLDQLEGHPTFYERRTITLSSGEEAWMYILPGEPGNIIEGGEWL